MEVSTAGHEDVENLLKLRDDAARWLLSRKINQWRPGELPRDWIDDQVAKGFVFVVRHASELVATVTVTFEDSIVWGTEDEVSGYVHRLIVDRHWAGQRIGLSLLEWAEDRIRESGRLIARLDCVRSNCQLRSYYETAGYGLVGYKDFPDISWASEAALYEKSLDILPA